MRADSAAQKGILHSAGNPAAPAAWEQCGKLHKVGGQGRFCTRPCSWGTNRHHTKVTEVRMIRNRRVSEHCCHSCQNQVTAILFPFLSTCCLLSFCGTTCYRKPIQLLFFSPEVVFSCIIFSNWHIMCLLKHSAKDVSTHFQSSQWLDWFN